MNASVHQFAQASDTIRRTVQFSEAVDRLQADHDAHKDAIEASIARVEAALRDFRGDAFQARAATLRAQPQAASCKHRITIAGDGL